MSTNKKLAVGRDLTIESFRKPEEPYVVASYRLKPQCIDESPTVRMYQPPMHNDPFLAYLEWKVSLPWHKRLFMP